MKNPINKGTILVLLVYYMILCKAGSCSNISGKDDSAGSDTNQTEPAGSKESNEKSELTRAQETAKAVNNVPDVHVSANQLVAPEPEKPIHGFHPVKKALQPVIRLEKNSEQLQQQIMKLEGPIAGLQKPMLGLNQQMSLVRTSMSTIHGSMGNMDTHIGSMEGKVSEVNGQMSAVRSDLGIMRKQINELQGPITQLQKPLGSISQPLNEVHEQLQSLQTELQKLQALVAVVLLVIIIAAIGIAIGTPVAAILLYRHRRNLFPQIPEHELPKVVTPR